MHSHAAHEHLLQGNVEQDPSLTNYDKYITTHFPLFGKISKGIYLQRS
jgi:hypothetical protein